MGVGVLWGEFMQCVGRVSPMSVGILLYTRVAGRVYYVVVADYTGIKINTREVGG